MPLIIGTAGHIDHGKTSLIRALTGQDTDRLKEEKERGISIDLGFAYLDGPGGARAGIVDVPGHERFIRNMLAGAHGMDLVLFTVAAEHGVVPQREEHLDLLHLLGRPPGTVLMPVDRALVMRGHGVVVSGTAIAGTVSEGDTVRVLPGAERARVRSLESHGVPVRSAGHGQRVAMNLAGVEREDLGRGHVVCDERIERVTDRLDAWVEVRSAARRPLPSHGRVRFHLGTAEVIGKLVVLGGGSALEPRTS